jgi:hypothetical protein
VHLLLGVGVLTCTGNLNPIRAVQLCVRLNDRQVKERSGEEEKLVILHASGQEERSVGHVDWLISPGATRSRLILLFVHLL